MYYINTIFLQTPRYETIDGLRVRINPNPDLNTLKGILVVLVYPLYYDGMQAIKQGIEYFADAWNYIDILHIVIGYLNVYF